MISVGAQGTEKLCYEVDSHKSALAAHDSRGQELGLRQARDFRPAQETQALF